MSRGLGDVYKRQARSSTDVTSTFFAVDAELPHPAIETANRTDIASAVAFFAKFIFIIISFSPHVMYIYSLFLIITASF